MGGSRHPSSEASSFKSRANHWFVDALLLRSLPGERYVINCVERGEAESDQTDLLNLCTACWVGLYFTFAFTFPHTDLASTARGLLPKAHQRVGVPRE